MVAGQGNHTLAYRHLRLSPRSQPRPPTPSLFSLPLQVSSVLQGSFQAISSRKNACQRCCLSSHSSYFLEPQFPQE